MRIFMLQAALVLGVTAGIAFGQEQETKPCPGETQFQMNNCMASEYRKADAELNRVYQQVLKKYAGYDRFLQKLKVAQKAWVAFRDAHLRSLYSEDDKVSNYGSVWPMCWSAHLTELTEARTAQLKQMLDPVEGDVCGFWGGPSAEPGRNNPGR